MSKERELLKQAEKWLEILMLGRKRDHEVTDLIKAIEEELAKLERGPFGFACPDNCGCLWRDNGNQTMSLFGKNSKSCEICESLPLSDLIPVYRCLMPYCVPVTYDEIVDFFKKNCRFQSNDLASFNRGFRLAEQHHGIGEK